MKSLLRYLIFGANLQEMGQRTKPELISVNPYDNCVKRITTINPKLYHA